uniref:SAM domain-containing protein n=1 Tax=Catharus ustulatus TaxID=91951 RepID=A0A8C3TXS8_CATUS
PGGAVKDLGHPQMEDGRAHGDPTGEGWGIPIRGTAGMENGRPAQAGIWGRAASAQGWDSGLCPPWGCPSPPAQAARLWSGSQVGSWLAEHGGAAELAREHALTGRALLRLNEGSLRRMGVTPRSRRRELLRELLRLRLLTAAGEHCCR